MTQTRNHQSSHKVWLEELTKLVAAVKKWSGEQGWIVQKDFKKIDEGDAPPYAAPSLLIQTPQVRLHIDPVGHDIMGADGRVDIVAYPSLHRMLLILDKDKWILKTDSYIDWPDGWSKKSFLKLVEILGKA